ncbi:hypothetical protein [Streptomyces murinus]|uniref:hypothetical protein n=1 Tax=Streptomyces murinus TaxID=33900 RepID=UPI00380E45CF
MALPLQRVFDSPGDAVVFDTIQPGRRMIRERYKQAIHSLGVLPADSAARQPGGLED